jgi:hypothetical protein
MVTPLSLGKSAASTTAEPEKFQARIDQAIGDHADGARFADAQHHAGVSNTSARPCSVRSWAFSLISGNFQMRFNRLASQQHLALNVVNQARFGGNNRLGQGCKTAQPNKARCPQTGESPVSWDFLY